jgi:2-methylisocitrate lyase-like PEP mutase family enzyme
VLSGYGRSFLVHVIRAQNIAIQLEDQSTLKRCGHFCWQGVDYRGKDFKK